MVEKEEGLPPALLGSCNDRAKQLHNSPSGIFRFNTSVLFLPQQVLIHNYLFSAIVLLESLF